MSAGEAARVVRMLIPIIIYPNDELSRRRSPRPKLAEDPTAATISTLKPSVEGGEHRVDSG
jgi:hypothetical protein